MCWGEVDATYVCMYHFIYFLPPSSEWIVCESAECIFYHYIISLLYKIKFCACLIALEDVSGWMGTTCQCWYFRSLLFSISYLKHLSYNFLLSALFFSPFLLIVIANLSVKLISSETDLSWNSISYCLCGPVFRCCSLVNCLILSSFLTPYHPKSYMVVYQ